MVPCIPKGQNLAQKLSVLLQTMQSTKCMSNCDSIISMLIAGNGKASTALTINSAAASHVTPQPYLTKL
eukprot:154788-Amphidinium_carterae.4